MGAARALHEGGSRTLRWINTGDIFEPLNDDLIAVAQAIADAEARGRAESSAEVARLTAEVESLERQLKTAWVELMGLRCPTCAGTGLVSVQCQLCNGDWDNGRMSCMGCTHGLTERPCACQTTRPQANEGPVVAVVDRAGLEADVLTISCALDALSALRYERIPTDDAAEVSEHNRTALSRIAAALGVKEPA